MKHLKVVSQTWVRLELIVYKGFFKYLLLNCTVNRDVCKRTCLIDAFIQHLIHFWLDLLRLFLDAGVQKCTPVITFNIDKKQFS